MVGRLSISTWVHVLFSEQNGDFCRLIRRSSFLLLLALLPYFSFAQCTVICKSALNVSLPVSGMVTISPDLLLEDADCDPSDFYVDIRNAEGVFIGNTVTCDGVGESWLAGVFHNSNGNSCFTTLNIQDYISPQINCQDTTILCILPYTPAAIGQPDIIENCQLSELTFSDEVFELACLTMINGDTITSRVERTWTATDESGNSSTCVQNIYHKKAGVNAVQFPLHRDGFAAPTVDCGGDPNDLSITGEPMIDGRPLSSGGSCQLVASHSDQLVPDCGDNAYKILRTWTVIDWCTGAFNLNVQIIKVTDSTAPVLQCPANIEVNTNSHDCSATVNLPLTSAMDDCSNVSIVPSWDFGTGYGPFTDVPQGVHQVTYTATDDCGNSSTCTMEVSVVDNIIPVMVCDANTVVYLNSAGIVEVDALAFDDGSSDNCALDRLEVSRDAVNFAPQVTFSCLDADQVLTVYLRAYDLRGNFNECNVEVTVREEVAPVMACPSNITLVCTDDFMDLTITGQPLSIDACGVDSLYFTDTDHRNVCGVGTIARVWTVLDVNGNSNACLQQITLEDNTPVQVFFPADYTAYTCNAPVDTSITGVPNVIDDCEQISINHDDVFFDIAAPACFKIFRTWTVVDWCVYDPNSGSTDGYYIHIQVISVLDQEAPTLTCPNDTIVGAISTTCDGTYVQLNPATAEDCSATIHFSNNSPFADANGADASGFYPLGIHQIQFTAEDGCGNSSTCSMTVVVQDATLPTLLCLSTVSVALTNDGFAVITPDMVENSSYDNCSASENMTFALSRDTFYCTDIGTQTVHLSLTDEAGNVSSCDVDIQVQDNTGICPPIAGTLSGKVLTEIGQGVENVTVELSGTVNATTQTDIYGNYEFNDLPLGGNYTLTPSKDVNPDNGVNTFDLIVISRHVLGMQLLPSPYKIIASDVNESVNTTSFDLVEIRKLLLNIDTAFAGVDAWTFVDANYVFVNPSFPLGENYPTSIQVNDLTGDLLDLDFVGVKTGDVNNSNNPSNLMGGDTRNTGVVKYLESDELGLEKGKSYQIPFRGGDLAGILGLQFSLQWDTGKVDFKQLRVTDYGQQLGWAANHFGYSHLEEGHLTASWVKRGEEPNVQEPLFYLEVTCRQDSWLSEVLQINSKHTKAEVYLEEQGDEEERLGQLDLVFKASKKRSDAFFVGQNQPNPVKDITQIPLDLPRAACGVLRIVDVQGRLLYRQAYCLDEGQQQIQLNVAELGLMNGIYVLELDWSELGRHQIKMQVVGHH
ncbi:MAG: HYR domain-containing protein [Bacteroidota bacterium]